MESRPNELYLMWERIREAASDRLALSDVKSGRSWTFGDVQAEVDALARLEPGALSCPGGFAVDLTWHTLRAWRDGAVLCPVERERGAPKAAALKGLPGEVCHLKQTSGSAGGARLVAFSGASLAADARKIVSTMGLRPEWPNLGVISMAHSYGFSSLVLPLLLHGIPLIWMGDPLPGAMAKALTCLPTGASGWTLPAVPAMWRLWQEAGLLGRGDIRLAISAGTPLPGELECLVHESAGLKIHNFYGSSECGGIAYDRSGLPRLSGGLAGTAMDDTFLSVTEEGCLEVRGPSVGLGYWPETKETAGQLANGVFRSSDLVALDATPDGSLAVSLGGRRDDVINVAGRKISPADIESVIGAMPGVRHALVFGVPSADPVRGEDIVAVVNWSGGAGDEASFQRQWRSAAEHLDAHQRPRLWWLNDELIPDRRGKLSRHGWRQRFLESRQAG